ncbi:SH2 domain containing 3Cb isoform X2 [Corythoichthys intestinalis]|uniref:SH2 domain containing 3Cb isoform X2 n=1 Tax=Corythoichthys intestinalis TaxID=161448 RepID=UPI0025A61E52|nr:SH2 domain containing 3Cb isoform X2 [Corythoichthys intestinalis]
MKAHKHSSGWLGSLANLSLRRPFSRRKVSAPPLEGSRTWPSDDTATSPQLWGYARSSAMYTHVGTVPRTDRQQNRMNIEEEEEGRVVRDHVQDSPLLSALSSLSLNALDQPSCSPATPDADQVASATQDVSQGAQATLDTYRGDPVLQEVYKGALAGLDVSKSSTAPQDVYVHMDAISDVVRRREITNYPQQEEHLHSPCDLKDRGGEYVRFSKDKKFGLEKQLQEELKLSTAYLKSHAWYHGPITKEVSENLVLNQGDFLIRDSELCLGEYVLTVHWDQKTIHLPVQTTAVRCGVHYSLDQEVFDSLPALVRFYAGSRAPLTRRCTAKFHQPVNRTLPLSYLETVFGPPPYQWPPSQAEEPCPRSPSLLHRDQQQPALSSSTDNMTLQSTSTNQSQSFSKSLDSVLPELNHDIQRPDSDDSGYTELFPGPQSFVERLRNEEAPRAVDLCLRPIVETVSSFSPTKYCSPLMPVENKPLEVGILHQVKELLARVDPQTAAQHITKWDCTIAHILEMCPEMEMMMGASSGVELLTLPHGQQLRLDLLERLHTMATMLAVNVLGCTGTTEERACVLHRMISIAAELKNNMGNMFGFSAVMRALELPQVARLGQTWTALRQRHTEGAVLYEKTLRPFMKNLNEGQESWPTSGTTFPHVLPLLWLLEKSAAVVEGFQGAKTLDAPEASLDVDLDVLMFQLEAARNTAQLGAVYAANARSKLQDFQEQADISEVFCTDFQMRLLWGSRGAVESQVRRYAKFNQVLTALSNRLEPPSC